MTVLSGFLRLSIGRGSNTAMTAASTMLLAFALFWCADPTNSAPVKTSKGACAVAKARVSAERHFPISVVAFCDQVDPAQSPKGYYVLALHGKRSNCRGNCGSTNMGWFAIRKADGRVFEWNVSDWKIGRAMNTP
jgi:hypothetical protein